MKTHAEWWADLSVQLGCSGGWWPLKTAWMNQRQSLCWCLWTQSHLSSLKTSPGRTASHLGGNGVKGQMEDKVQEEENRRQ